VNDFSKPGNGSNALCLECGLCCNGVIFADVQLQPGDDPVRLQALGLSIHSKNGPRPAPGSRRKPNSIRRKFAQPCTAFEGCRCRVYAERPEHCRAFECLLLKSVKAGRIQPAAALEVIREARRRTDVVEDLLQQFGDSDKQSPLRARFRRIQKRAETEAWEAGKGLTYSQLTLAMHDLNLILSDRFYAG
jgi:Fe-S-cluster containining protein